MTESTELSDELLHAEPARWLPRLTGLLDEQYELCTALDALSAQQSSATSVGDTDALLRIVGRRQGVVDRVAAINGELAGFRAHQQELFAKLAPNQRDAIVQRVGRIAALVENVRARDDADRAAIERMKTAIADELNALSKAKGAAAAYAANSYANGARFQDRNG